MLSSLSPARLAEICDGQWYQQTVLPASFCSAQIDSRIITDHELFIALKGDHVDGHQFVRTLDPERGQAAIVESPAPEAKVAQLCVSDSLQALHKLSREVSALTDAVKFAVTGSVGKTGTKDMLCRMVEGFGRAHATKGNYNNHIGAPLTIAQMPDHTEFLVCELGMNHAGEITKLAHIVRPYVAAITCIADSHIGHFQSREQIADAKAEIFDGLVPGGRVVLPRDDAFYQHLADAAVKAGAGQIISFGTHPDSTLCLTECKKEEHGLVITARYSDSGEKSGYQTHSFRLGMTARHWAMNALCALGMCYAAGLDIRMAAEQLAGFTDLPGRGKAYDLNIDGCHITLIDDSYNAGPLSMQAALASLAETPGRRAAVLSDMLELGPSGAHAHEQLAHHISASGISHLLAIGPMMTAMTAQLPADISYQCFATSTEALDAVTKNPAMLAGNADYLLIKGSHGSGAHRISQHLITSFSRNTTEQEISHAS